MNLQGKMGIKDRSRGYLFIVIYVYKRSVSAALMAVVGMLISTYFTSSHCVGIILLDISQLLCFYTSQIFFHFNLACHRYFYITSKAFHEGINYLQKPHGGPVGWAVCDIVPVCTQYRSIFL